MHKHQFTDDKVMLLSDITEEYLDTINCIKTTLSKEGNFTINIQRNKTVLWEYFVITLEYKNIVVMSFDVTDGKELFDINLKFFNNIQNKFAEIYAYYWYFKDKLKIIKD